MDKNDTQFNSDLSNENKEITMTEHLSALLDDEAGSFEQRRVLDELRTSDELSQRLSHFALIGESMRSTKPVAVAGSDFLAGIHAQIDAEPEYHKAVLQTPANDQDVKKSSWLRPVGGFALAASVAAVAVIGVQNYQQQGNGNTDQMVVSAPIDSLDLVENSSTKQLSQAQMDAAVVVSADKMDLANDVASVSNYQDANARTRSLLKRFVDKHIRHASTSSFVPSVRVIAYADYK